MPPLTGRPDPPGRLGLRSAWFCEQCGTNREQLGDEFQAPIRECLTCRQAVCPNCWNVVATSCLRCVPFSLPIVEAPAPVSAVLSAPAAAVAPEPPARGRTADRLRRRLAKVVPTAPAAEPAVLAMVLAPPPVATPTTPAAPDAKAKRGAKAASTTAAAAFGSEVQWPDRSVDWELRVNATAADRPLPARPEPAAPGSAARLAGSASRSVPAGRVGRSRAASLAGFTVVIVALFGVAGLTLTALGLPGSDQTDGQTATPAPTERVGVPGAAATMPADATPPGDVPPLDANGSKDHHAIEGGGGDGSTTPGNGGAPGGGDTPLIGLTPAPTTAATPAPTGASTAAPTPTSPPTATPTPDPTPTPTPDPTPDPTPTPTPEPTPDPTPTPEPTD